MAEVPTKRLKLEDTRYLSPPLVGEPLYQQCNGVRHRYLVFRRRETGFVRTESKARSFCRAVSLGCVLGRPCQPFQVPAAKGVITIVPPESRLQRVPF